MTTLPLGSEFSAQTHDAWLKLVEKTLKGADFEKALVTRTYDGIPIQPIYARDTSMDAARIGETPGLPPYTRGVGQPGSQPLPWHICQTHAHPDPGSNNSAILTDLEGGVSALSLKASDSSSDGILVTNTKDLDIALSGVSVDIAPVFLEPTHGSIAIAALLLATIEEREADTETVSGNLGVDPFGLLASTGHLDQSVDEALAQMSDLAHHVSASFPNIASVLVDTRSYHYGGASDAQEIAIAIATGVSYLRALEENGLDLATSAGQIGFAMTTDSDLFASVSKLRTARQLWAKVTAACGIEPAPMNLRVESAARMMSDRDVWVNMLRTTVACFAAGIAGAQAVTLQPYTAASGLPDGFARRIARNTQIILQEESSVGLVTDPAGGSWFMEKLTNDLAEKSWSLFQEIECEGGIASSLASGNLQDRIAKVRDLRITNVARRKDPIVGVSEFPNLDENKTDVLPVDVVDIKTASDRRLQEHLQRRGWSFDPTTISPPARGVMTKNLIDAGRQGATLSELTAGLAGELHTVEALTGARLSIGFESLRTASDDHTARTGSRPAVFLACLGTAGDFTARAAFSKNLFGAGGIETLQNAGFADEESLTEAFRKTSAKAAVICSSDAVYADRAVSAAAALRSAGAIYVYLAGHPGERRVEFEHAGIATFIHMGCNVIDVLEQAHQVLGVQQS